MDESLDRAHPHLGRGRFKKRREDGSLVELEDHTQWAVPPGHEIFVDHWTRDAEVTVVPGDFQGYPYDLINLESGERVPAKYVGFVDPELGWSLIDD